MDINAAKDKIRSKIRSGMKTSEIILEGEFPVDLIKSVKSEELVLDKEVEKEFEANRWREYTAAKQRKRDEEFLQKYDLKKEQETGSAT